MAKTFSMGMLLKVPFMKTDSIRKRTRGQIKAVSNHYVCYQTVNALLVMEFP